jgi:hypothetical protein
MTSNAALNSGNVVRGSVLRALVFDYYPPGKNAALMYDINHIQKITLQGESLEPSRILGSWL